MAVQNASSSQLELQGFDSRSRMPLIQFWNTKERPDYIDARLASFRQHNPGLPHLVFDHRAADAFIDGNFTDRELAAFRSCAVPAMQSDYFRYCALLGLGGMYSDADYRCVASLAPFIDSVRGGELFIRPNGNVVNAFVAFASPGQPFLRLALEMATANIEKRIAEDVWLTTGPGIFTFMTLLFQLGSIDAFMGEFAPEDWRREYAEFLCEVIDDYARVAHAFEEVRFRPYAAMQEWIRGGALPYQSTNVHWTRWKGSIFRQSTE